MKTIRRSVELYTSWWSSGILFFDAPCIEEDGWYKECSSRLSRFVGPLGVWIALVGSRRLVRKLAGELRQKKQYPWSDHRHWLTRSCLGSSSERLTRSLYAARASAFVKCRLINIWSRTCGLVEFRSSLAHLRMRAASSADSKVTSKGGILDVFEFESEFFFFNRNVDDTLGTISNCVLHSSMNCSESEPNWLTGSPSYEEVLRPLFFRLELSMHCR